MTTPKSTGNLSIPDAIQQRRDLSATEKDILAVIGRRQGRIATATMYQEEIAQQAGVSVDTVSRKVQSLKGKGELKVLHRTKRTVNGFQRLASIYSVKYITERNLRWAWHDRAEEKREDKAMEAGKLTRLPPRNLR